MQCDGQLSVCELQKARQPGHDVCCTLCTAANDVRLTQQNTRFAGDLPHHQLPQSFDAASSYLCLFPEQTLLSQCLSVSSLTVCTCFATCYSCYSQFFQKRGLLTSHVKMVGSPCKTTNLLGSQLMDNIQELLQIPPLKGYCCVRAGQDGHEMVHSRLKVSRVPEGAA